MSKKNKATETVTPAQIAPAVAETSKVVEVLMGMETVKQGRPIDLYSKRQIREREMAAKRINGEKKLGRPVNPESKAHLDKMAKEERKANGEGGKKGRPIDLNSPRQQELIAKEARKQARIEAYKKAVADGLITGTIIGDDVKKIEEVETLVNEINNEG